MAQNIILYSTADWDNPFWTNKQHMAVHLSKRGYRILYVESLGLRAPTIKPQDIHRIWRRLCAFFKGNRKVQENIWVYSPIVFPFSRFKLVAWLNHVTLKTILRYYKNKLAMQTHWALTYNPTIAKLISSQKPKKVIYHSVDDLSSSPRMNSSWIKQQEKDLFQISDHVFCTSKKIYQHCQQYVGNKAHYFPNVVDKEHFEKARKTVTVPNDIAKIKKPRIGFIGAISSYKVDFQMIHDAAKSDPNLNFILIGKVGEGQPDTKIESLELPNIHLLGPKPYQELPYYLASFDMAIIPCPLNNYTQSMFPMKFFEYLAAGKKVISSPIHSLEEFNPYYTQIINGNLYEAILRSDKTNFNQEEIDRIISKYTWQKRLESMLSKIGHTC